MCYRIIRQREIITVQVTLARLAETAVQHEPTQSIKSLSGPELQKTNDPKLCLRTVRPPALWGLPRPNLAGHIIPPRTKSGSRQPRMQRQMATCAAILSPFPGAGIPRNIWPSAGSGAGCLANCLKTCLENCLGGWRGKPNC